MHVHARKLARHSRNSHEVSFVRVKHIQRYDRQRENQESLVRIARRKKRSLIGYGGFQQVSGVVNERGRRTGV